MSTLIGHSVDLFPGTKLSTILEHSVDLDVGTRHLLPMLYLMPIILVLVPTFENARALCAHCCECNFGSNTSSTAMRNDIDTK